MTNNKMTYIKAYIYDQSDHDFIMIDKNSQILIGEEQPIMNYIKEKGFKYYYVEYLCKNSIHDLIDYSYIDARIEPGAIIRQSASIGKDAIIMMGAVVNKGARIDEGTMIDMNAVIGGNAKIGKYCHIGAGSVIAGNIEPYCEKCVEIGDYSFIGANVVVVEGVQIGKNAVIGAGSVVLYDVKDNEVVVGNPAKVIKQRDEETLAKTKINMDLR